MLSESLTCSFPLKDLKLIKDLKLKNCPILSVGKQMFIFQGFGWSVLSPFGSALRRSSPLAPSLKQQAKNR
jgi:hypothetical protein